jgi:hypothetical protein
VLLVGSYSITCCPILTILLLSLLTKKVKLSLCSINEASHDIWKTPPFLTSALNGSTWTASHPGRYIPRRARLHTLHRRSDRPQSQWWRCIGEKKLLHLPGMELRALISVGIAKGYDLDCWGSILGRSMFFLFSTSSRPTPVLTQLPIQLSVGAVSHLMRRSRMLEIYSHSVIRPHAMMLN